MKEQLKDQLLGRLGIKAETLGELTEELRSLLKHPRSVSSWIETKSPWLSRQFLGAASNFVEPFTVGMGLGVEKLTEDSVEVAMPGYLRNQGERGTVHVAALSVLGELAARLFWEYHLDLKSAELKATRVQTRLLARATGNMRGVFRLAVAEREAILHKLRAEGSARAESVTQVYDENGRMVAEVEVDWELAKQLALSAGGSQS